MNPINEVIADLVARGFVLPEGLEWNRHGFWTTYGVDSRDVELPPKQALDLAACAFARQYSASCIRQETMHADHPESLLRRMSHGDTEAALRVLWEATG